MSGSRDLWDLRKHTDLWEHPAVFINVRFAINANKLEKMLLHGQISPHTEQISTRLGPTWVNKALKL